MAFNVADLQMIVEEANGFGTIDKQLNANVKFAQIILNNQTAQFDPLSDPQNPKKMRLWWKEICRQAMVDCADNCDISGTEGDLAYKDVEITDCKQTAPIILGENKFRHSTIDRIGYVAQELASRLRDADEFLAKELVASAFSFAGSTAFTGGYNFNATRNSLEIPAIEFNEGLIPFIAQFVAMNQNSDAMIIDGGNLFQKLYASEQLKANFGGLMVDFDLFNITGNANTANSTFILDKSAIALKTLSYHPVVPMVYTSGANITKYSVPSQNLPGVVYDVFYQTECVGANNDIVEKWAVQVNYGIFQTPLSGCSATDTGIYLLDCVTA
jgi:hypothetical protein